MKSVLITGGSSGIGFEMSRHWAKAGYRLLWVSISEEELRGAEQKIKSEIGGVEVHTLVKDLSLSESAQAIFAWAKNIAPIEVLINNAGFGTHGYQQEISIDKELSMIQLHVLSLYKMTRLFLDDMLSRDAGTIINISSNSAFQPVARMSTYAATKAFVYQFSRGVEEELRLQKSKVKVITVCPAAIADTPFKDQISPIKTYRGLATTTTKEVGLDVWNGFRKGKTFIVSGRKMRFLYILKNILPYSFKQYLVRMESAESK